MLSKDQRKLKGSTPVAAQNPTKNININISYNITVDKNNKPTLINSLISSDKQSKRRKSTTSTYANKDKTMQAKEKLVQQHTASSTICYVEQQPKMRTDKTQQPPYNIIDNYLHAKLMKPARNKKSHLHIVSRTEQTRMGMVWFNEVKLKTQEASTNHILNPHIRKHNRVLSKDRSEGRTKVKSTQLSRRNNSDGQKKVMNVSKQHKSKQYAEKRKTLGSMTASLASKHRSSTPNSKQKNGSYKMPQQRRQRKVKTEYRQYTHNNSPTSDHFPRGNQTLVEKIMQTEISSMIGQTTQNSPQPRLCDLMFSSKDVGKNKNSLTKPNFLKNKGISSPLKKAKMKTCLTDRLKEEAAKKIQRAWRAHQKRKLLSYYGNIFNRHCPAKIVTEPKTPNFDTPCHINPLIAVDRINEFAILTVDEYDQQSPSRSEEQFQFNIRKYEDIVGRSIEVQKRKQRLSSSNVSSKTPISSNAQSPAVSIGCDKELHQQTVSTDEIEFFKAHQLEQWNKINNMISQHLLDRSQHDNLLKQLIRHTETNKKWIEEQHSSPVKNKQGNISPLPPRYRSLVEETGIVQRLKNKSGSEKRCLESWLGDEWGTLSSNSSKKHPQVYIAMENQSLSNEQKNSESIEKLMKCQFGKVKQSDGDQLPVFNNGSGLLHEYAIKQQEQYIFPKVLSKSAHIEQVVSEEELSEKQRFTKPVEDDSWRKLSLEHLSKSDDYSKNQQQKESMDQNNVRSEQMNKLMRRQLFSHQAIYETILQLEITLACEQIVDLQIFHRQIQNNTVQSKNQFKFSQAKKAAAGCGIKTDFGEIKKWITGFIDYMVDEAPEMDVARILRNLNKPLGPSSKEVLQYLSLRETAYDLSSSSSDNSEDCTEYVINISFFHNYETKKADQQISEKKQSYTYYWHQAIFEAFNEYLDEFRPFGVYGQPYVWEVDGRTHSNYTKVSNFKSVLLKAADKLYIQAAFMAGIIFDKEEGPFADGHILQQTKREVNQQRMSRMLAHTLIEDQPNFVNYKDEVVELQIELSYTITEALIRQIVLILHNLNRKRQL